MRFSFRISLFAVICLYSLGFSQQDVQIIRAGEIEASGAVILSDIFQLIDKWNASSIDGYNWSVSANGLSHYQRQNFKILIDGHPADLNILDNQNVNLLPFSVNQIDSIEVFNSPDIISGNFAEAGLIHIHLKKPQHDLSSQIVYSTGNETGDPGPYKFTSYSSPNIDKLNTILSGAINYGSRSWDMSLGIKREENFDTDANIIRRVHHFQQSNDKALLTSGLFKLNLHMRNSSHSFFTFYSDQFDYPHFRYYGNEIPVNRIISLASVNGSFNLSRKLELNYLVQAGTNRLLEWLGPDPDWTNAKFRGDLDLLYKYNSFVFSGGISLKRDNLKTSRDLIENSISLRSFYLTVNYKSGRTSDHRFGFYSSDYKSSRSYKAIVSNRVHINTFHELFGTISFSTKMLQEDLNFPAWWSNGFYIENTAIAEYGEIGTGKTFTGDLVYRYTPTSSISAEAGLSYRRFKDQYVENDIYFYSPSEGSLSAFTNIIAGTQLSEGVANIAIQHQITNSFHYKIAYTYTRTLSGTDISRKLWEVFPEHKTALTIDYKPSSDFGIWSRLSYFSPAGWTEYSYVKFQSQGIYDDEVNSGAIWDLALKKGFAKNLIRANVIVRNILNEKQFYNPIGAQFNLRFFIQIVVNLDNLPE